MSEAIAAAAAAAVRARQGEVMASEARLWMAMNLAAQGARGMDEMRSPRSGPDANDRAASELRALYDTSKLMVKSNRVFERASMSSALAKMAPMALNRRLAIIKCIPISPDARSEDCAPFVSGEIAVGNVLRTAVAASCASPGFAIGIDWAVGPRDALPDVRPVVDALPQISSARLRAWEAKNAALAEAAEACAREQSCIAPRDDGRASAARAQQAILEVERTRSIGSSGREIAAGDVAYIVEEDAGSNSMDDAIAAIGGTISSGSCAGTLVDVPFVESLMLQVRHALDVAWELCGFVHYDLHGGNVRLKKINNPAVANSVWAFRAATRRKRVGRDGSFVLRGEGPGPHPEERDMPFELCDRDDGTEYPDGEWILVPPAVHRGVVAKIIDFGRSRVDRWWVVAPWWKRAVAALDGERRRSMSAGDARHSPSPIARQARGMSDEEAGRESGSDAGAPTPADGGPASASAIADALEELDGVGVARVSSGGRDVAVSSPRRGAGPSGSAGVDLFDPRYVRNDGMGWIQVPPSGREANLSYDYRILAASMLGYHPKRVLDHAFVELLRGVIDLGSILRSVAMFRADGARDGDYDGGRIAERAKSLTQKDLVEYANIVGESPQCMNFDRLLDVVGGARIGRREAARARFYPLHVLMDLYFERAMPRDQSRPPDRRPSPFARIVADFGAASLDRIRRWIASHGTSAGAVTVLALDVSLCSDDVRDRIMLGRAADPPSPARAGGERLPRSPKPSGARRTRGPCRTTSSRRTTPASSAGLARRGRLPRPAAPNASAARRAGACSTAGTASTAR